MKRTLIFATICGMVVFTCDARERLTQNQVPWYRSYHKAVFTGAIIGTVTILLHPFGHALLISRRGEMPAQEVLKQWWAKIPDTILVNIASGAIAGLIVAVVAKFFDERDYRIAAGHLL